MAKLPVSGATREPSELQKPLRTLPPPLETDPEKLENGGIRPMSYPSPKADFPLQITVPTYADLEKAESDSDSEPDEFNEAELEDIDENTITVPVLSDEMFADIDTNEIEEE
jgi:hypothetical protein